MSKTELQTPQLRRRENWLLLGFFAALTVQVLWTDIQDVEASENVIMVDRMALSVVMALWVMWDSARHGIKRPFIFGVFLLVAWTVMVPFHLWRTRRWGAVKTVLIFIGLCVVTMLPYAVRDVMNFMALAPE